MTPTPADVGAYVLGPPTAPRALARHADLLAAYADGVMLDRGEDREAYLSHFAFGPEMPAHYAASRNSVAGFAGPCRCRRLVLDIDRADPAAALADARKLVAFLHQRYPEAEGDVPVYFSGGKGYHVLVDLAHNPPPAVGFHRTARAFAEAVAARAGVTIDSTIYDLAHLIRLPNTRHPKTGLYKRRIDADALFRLDPGGIRYHARHPAGDGMPAARRCPAMLAGDWHEAEQDAARTAAARAARRGTEAGTPDARAPRYFVDFLRFLTEPGERHRTVFRCAAWLTEQGAPASLCFALLTEPGRDAGLSPADVGRQIACGIDHARRQRGPAVDAPPDPDADPDAFERWAIEHEADPLPSGAPDFPFGAAAPVRAERGPA